MAQQPFLEHSIEQKHFSFTLPCEKVNREDPQIFPVDKLKYSFR